MRASSILPYLSVGAATISGAAAADASYDTIPAIEVYGQHFFYTNNGSQLYGLPIIVKIGLGKKKK